MIKHGGPQNEEDCEFFTTYDGNSYRTGSAVELESLNARQEDPYLATNRIDLLNGDTFRSDSIHLDKDSLRYRDRDEQNSIPLSTVSRITVIRKYTIGNIWTNTRDGGLLFGPFFLIPGRNRDTYREAGKKFLIGAGIGSVVGNLLVYLDTRSDRWPHTTYIYGFEECQE